jgi:hypothetical protein
LKEDDIRRQISGVQAALYEVKNEDMIAEIEELSKKRLEETREKIKKMRPLTPRKRVRKRK